MPINAQGESAAWILPLAGQWRAAVGERELVHLIESPTLLEVPQSPFYCRQVLRWHDRLLPAMDLAAWLTGHAGQSLPHLAGIFAYQSHPDDAIHYGALLLHVVPTRVWVSDQQACALPVTPVGWKPLAISCFAEGDNAIPILDLPAIFSGALLRS
jgi:hypothetical protein